MMVRESIKALPPSGLTDLRARIEGYLDFRRELDRFFEHYFSEVCTEMCYEDNHSACCNREGIITFFADVVVNVLMSQEGEVEDLLQVLNLPHRGLKCIYLGKRGCLWRVKPIVCEMFLCEHARNTVFGREPKGLQEWKRLRGREKRYTWPDRPVLFDELETYFMGKGCSSSLMYCHNSPGLLRIKALARKGIKATARKYGEDGPGESIPRAREGDQP